MQGQTLDADAAQLVDGIKLAVLPTKTERAGGHDHRVFIVMPASGDGVIAYNSETMNYGYVTADGVRVVHGAE